METKVNRRDILATERPYYLLNMQPVGQQWDDDYNPTAVQYASHEFPRLLINLNVHYRAHNSPSTVPTLSAYFLVG
jgi:hypothetical protein